MEGEKTKERMRRKINVYVPELSVLVDIFLENKRLDMLVNHKTFLD